MIAVLLLLRELEFPKLTKKVVAGYPWTHAFRASPYPVTIMVQGDGDPPDGRTFAPIWASARLGEHHRATLLKFVGRASLPADVLRGWEPRPRLFHVFILHARVFAPNNSIDCINYACYSINMRFCSLKIKLR
ncbi:MAG: hypothetical protein AMJ91_02625 [candidate division Zixibacteria bacterium SM23_73_3]|nr:MAG: hypothetical protein AMJ91_02625 [candidate division Zixibacteria bacterium SM23_73_3]